MSSPTFTQPSHDELLTLLNRYDLGAYRKHSVASNGIENSNYFLVLDQHDKIQEYVLTILEQPSTSSESLVPLLDLCADKGLPVPPIKRNRAGAAYEEICSKPAIITPRLPGQHAFNPTSKQCVALGRFIARFHLATRSIVPDLPAYPRDQAWLKTQANLTKGYVPFADQELIENTVSRVCDMLNRQDVNKLPHGVIHGDLFRDNVLFNERGLSGVLDFHHASAGPWLYDIAVAANDWCTDTGGVLDPDRTMALLRAYHQVRPLTPEEIWFFSSFTLYGAVAFWLSRLSVALHRDANDTVRFNNPDEFKDIVAHHSAHFFYLDQRLLNTG